MFGLLVATTFLRVAYYFESESLTARLGKTATLVYISGERSEKTLLLLGNLSNDDGNGTKTLLENISLRYLHYFAIIPNRSACTMWPKYPATKLTWMAFK